jgi:hypothetical protein
VTQCLWKEKIWAEKGQRQPEEGDSFKSEKRRNIIRLKVGLEKWGGKFEGKRKIAQKRLHTAIHSEIGCR